MYHAAHLNVKLWSSRKWLHPKGTKNTKDFLGFLCALRVFGVKLFLTDWSGDTGTQGETKGERESQSECVIPASWLSRLWDKLIQTPD